MAVLEFPGHFSGKHEDHSGAVCQQYEVLFAELPGLRIPPLRLPGLQGLSEPYEPLVGDPGSIVGSRTLHGGEEVAQPSLRQSPPATPLIPL